jgi:hypothetical protein
MRVTAEQAGSADGSLRAVVGRLPGRILGIDAGGSGTRVVILQGGKVTPQPEGPPMNALLTEGFAGHLLQIIGAAGATAAGIGLPGLRLPDQARRLAAMLARQTGCPVHVTGDGASAGRSLPRRSWRGRHRRYRVGGVRLER